MFEKMKQTQNINKENHTSNIVQGGTLRTLGLPKPSPTPAWIWIFSMLMLTAVVLAAGFGLRYIHHKKW